MFANQDGRVIGEALSDATDWEICPGDNPNSDITLKCTTVLVFVNLSDYYGMPVELAMARQDQISGADGLSNMTTIDSSQQGLGSDTVSIRLATAMPTKQEKHP